MPAGFKRHELRHRYDVVRMEEDSWHTYTGEKTAQIVCRTLAACRVPPKLLLNAGAGVYAVGRQPWKEISIDLFVTPIQPRRNGVCASVEWLPFKSQTFGAIVCVGEVLAYCDPAAAIREFGRTLVRGGVLICDFASSRSLRYWLRRRYGRAADIVTDDYNGEPERTWVYDPKYIRYLLESGGFAISKIFGTHSWSALGRRIGLAPEPAVKIQRLLDHVPLPSRAADLTTIVAARV